MFSHGYAGNIEIWNAKAEVYKCRSAWLRKLLKYWTIRWNQLGKDITFKKEGTIGLSFFVYITRKIPSINKQVTKLISRTFWKIKKIIYEEGENHCTDNSNWIQRSQLVFKILLLFLLYNNIKQANNFSFFTRIEKSPSLQTNAKTNSVARKWEIQSCLWNYGIKFSFEVVKKLVEKMMLKLVRPIFDICLS